MKKTNRLLVWIPERVYVRVGELNPRPEEADAVVINGGEVYTTGQGTLRTKDQYRGGPVKARQGDIWMIRANVADINEAVRASLGVESTPDTTAQVATADSPVCIAAARITELGQSQRPGEVRTAERVYQVEIDMEYYPATKQMAGAAQFLRPLVLGPHDAVVIRGVIDPSKFSHAATDAAAVIRETARAAKERRLTAKAQPAKPVDNIDEDEVTG